METISLYARRLLQKISTLSRQKLTMKIVGYGVKAKVIFDLMTITDRAQS